jgi:hypothetical protein
MAVARAPCAMHARGVDSRAAGRYHALAMSRRLVCALSLVSAAGAWGAQSPFPEDPFNQDLLPAVVELPVAEPLVFELLLELPLPGPLPGTSPRRVAGGVAVGVAGGVAIAPLEAGRAPVIHEGEPDAAEVRPECLTDDGRRRYRTLPDGSLLAEKRCVRCETGWRKRWRLRIPGNPGAAPLLDGRRLYVGGMDNRVYAVRAGNGHRLWSTDVSSRADRPLVLWKSAGHRSVVLAVAADGQQLIALDGATGQPVASVRLGHGEGKVVGVPLALDDGRIVIAHQQYEESRAQLEVYALRGLPEDGVPASGSPVGSAEEPEARTTISSWPERTSAPSEQRSSTSSARSGSPAPP